ncbi:MAG: hypothetical protein U0235_21715 [Polyangiaceae bacterium]
MLRLARAFVVVPFLALLAPAACAPAASSTDESSEAELRALSASEILGTLTYGQTSDPVDYSSTPLYRAFKFQGTAGDQVEAWVRSTDGGDARAWLVTSTFKNVVSNDNASGSTLDAKLSTTLNATGTYYIVFRDKKNEDATFTVSLAKLGAPACDPEEEDCAGGGGGGGGGGGSASDPFSSASCTGPALTKAQALAMIDVPRGVLEKKVGRFALKRRSRVCYPGQPCSAWRDGGSEITATFDRLSATFTTAASEQSYHLNTQGDVVVSYENNAPVVRVRGDNFHVSWGALFTPTYLDQLLTTVPMAPGAVSDAAMSVDYVWWPSLGCPNGHCAGNERVPGGVAASWSGKALSVHGVMTSSCIRLAQTGTESLKDTNNNGYTLENELVILGDFAAASCKPKTCAEATFTCGSLDDGCGGKLDCGTCKSNETCETSSGPNHCRQDTPYESCAKSGRVYCPGYGCYDACN